MNTLTVPPDQGNLSAGNNHNLGMLLQEGCTSVTGEVQFTLPSNIVWCLSSYGLTSLLIDVWPKNCISKSQSKLPPQPTQSHDLHAAGVGDRSHEPIRMLAGH